MQDCEDFKFEFCWFCHLHSHGMHSQQAFHTESTWVIEVFDMDGNVVRRYAACAQHVLVYIQGMINSPPQAPDGEYSIVRRWRDTDVILEFDHSNPLAGEQ